MARTARALAALTLAVGLVACGDDSAETTVTTTAPATTTTLTAGTPAVCGPLAAVVRIADNFALEINHLTEELYSAAASDDGLDAAEEAALVDGFRFALSTLDELTATLVGHYNDAASLAPTEDLATEIRALRDATTLLMPIMEASLADATTFEEFSSSFEAALADPEVTEVALAGGLAALRIDEFSIPECGFKVSND